MSQWFQTACCIEEKERAWTPPPLPLSQKAKGTLLWGTDASLLPLHFTYKNMQMLYLFDIKEHPLFPSLFLFLSFLPKTADGPFNVQCRSPGCTTEGDRDRNQHMHLPSKAQEKRTEVMNIHNGKQFRWMKPIVCWGKKTVTTRPS